ncbi:hypothetical protein C8J56DRAFT_924208 [Mycena floridula]|nr:hypothetical protein C8J56DRAFT_924208 [Mycena floridula]
MLVVVTFYWLFLCSLPYIISTRHAADLGTSIQAISWPNVASHIGAFLAMENSSLASSDCCALLILLPSVSMRRNGLSLNLSLTSFSSIDGLADADHVERHVQAQEQIEQIAVSLASSQPSSTRLVSHSSIDGLADADHVERHVQAQEQIEQIAVSLASSQPSSTRLVPLMG